MVPAAAAVTATGVRSVCHATRQRHMPPAEDGALEALCCLTLDYQPAVMPPMCFNFGWNIHHRTRRAAALELLLIMYCRPLRPHRQCS